MTTQSSTQTTTAYTIPGVAEPIPVSAITALVAGSEISGAVAEPTQTDWYRFSVQAHVPNTVTFTASVAEYTLQPYLRYIDKGSANAHSPQPGTIPTTDVRIYTFQLAESNEIFLAIARLEGTTGSSTYSLRLAVDPIDKGSANAH